MYKRLRKDLMGTAAVKNYLRLIDVKLLEVHNHLLITAAVVRDIKGLLCLLTSTSPERNSNEQQLYTRDADTQKDGHPTSDIR